MASDILFDNDLLKENLKAKAIRGGAITLFAQVAKFLLRLVSTAVLARLLTPEDYGMIGMTMVISGLVGVLRDGGLVHATIQKESITHQQVSLLFWINAGLGVFIAVALIAISPLVSYIYGEPRLVPLLCALGIPFLLGGFSVQHTALLQRQMKFVTFSVIQIVAIIGGLVVGIWLASSGVGYWALAWIEIVSAAITLVLVWVFLRWKPSIPERSEGGFEMLRFGGNILIFNVVNYLSRNSDKALIGWLWGAGPLGLYARAYSLLMMPIRNIIAPLSSVALPILSRSRSDPSRLKRYFLQGMSVVVASVVPSVVCAAVFADDLVRLWLGERWMESASLFQILSLPALLLGASKPIGWLYTVMDRTHVLRNVGLVMAPVNILAFVIGLPYGARGVAVAYAISSCIMFLPASYYALKGTGIGMVETFATWIRPLVAASMGAVAGLLVRWFLGDDQSPIVTAASAISTFSLVYILLMVVAFGWWRRIRLWGSTLIHEKGNGAKRLYV